MSDKPRPDNLKDALAEIDQLRRIVAKPLTAIWLQVEAEVREQWFGDSDSRAEIRRLRDLLARLEWAGRQPVQEGGTVPACPTCEAIPSFRESHRPGCELAAALHPDPEQAP